MRILLLAVLLYTIAAIAEKQVPTCTDGSNAIAKGDLYCCIEDGYEYCCMKNDRYHCKKPQPTDTTAANKRIDGSRAHELMKTETSSASDDKSLFQKPRKLKPFKFGKSRAKNEDEPGCPLFPVTRTAMATLRDAHKYSNFPRIYTVALAQQESCEPPQQLTVRVTGVDPGKLYNVMVGESIACGGTRNLAYEVAKFQLGSRAGAVQVPSTVKSISELRGQTVSLTSEIDEGEPATFACGTFRVF